MPAKRHDARDLLADAAARLFLEQGYDAVSVDDIAAAAGVSRRTFFRLFPRKEAVFFADHTDRLERLRVALCRRHGETPYDAARRALLLLAAEYDAAPQQMAHRNQMILANRELLAWDLQLDLAYEEALVATLAQDADDPLRATVLGGAMMGVVRAVLRAWFANGTAGSLVELGGQALSLLEQGFNPARGRVLSLEAR